MNVTGVVPACILPLDTELQIDEPAYRSHLDWLASTPGVAAVTCNGHAAEVSSLSREEKRRTVAVAAETVAGRVPLISGLYADDARDGVPLAQDAHRAGADALLVMPPNSLAYDADPQAAYRYFERLSAAVPLPLVAFVYPQQTGFQYPAHLVKRICDLDSVVAVKEWSLDIRVHERHYEIVKSANHPVSLLTSFSPNLLPALVSGADGILSGHGSVIAGLQVAMFEAVSSGDLNSARETYARVQRLTKVIYRDPMPNMYARMKEQLIMLGHQLSPAVRRPLVPVTESERRDLRRALMDAGLLPVSV
jgi:4-hydroxy-tetrahydrodipicolinate synthase